MKAEIKGKKLLIELDIDEMSNLSSHLLPIYRVILDNKKGTDRHELCFDRGRAIAKAVAYYLKTGTYHLNQLTFHIRDNNAIEWKEVIRDILTQPTKYSTYVVEESL